MKLNPADVLNPIFNALDALISNYGVYCYLVFVWLSLAVIAWVLSGGLRRKRPQGNSTTIISGIIITTRPPMQSPPPIIGIEIDPARDATAMNAVRAHAPAFRDYARSLGTEPNSVGQVNVFHQAVGCASPAPDTTPERLLHEAAEQTRVAEALRAASVNPDGHGLLPQTAEQLAVTLFSNALPENERHAAVGNRVSMDG
jgi:hypothetical protein